MMNNYTFEFIELDSLVKHQGVDYRRKILVILIVIFVLGVGLFVQKQIYLFLKTKNERLVNKIIFSQLIVSNICFPIWLIQIVLIICINDVSQYITDCGCYIINYLLNFNVTFMLAHSFYTNLFRYICIVHDDDLIKSGISPKVKELLKCCKFKLYDYLQYQHNVSGCYKIHFNL